MMGDSLNDLGHRDEFEEDEGRRVAIERKTEHARERERGGERLIEIPDGLARRFITRA